MRRIIILFCLIVGLFGSHLKAQQLDMPSPPQQWVTDVPNLLAEHTRNTLNKHLEDYQNNTGHQVLVWIGTSTGDTPLEDWTIKAFESWKVGRSGVDDGVILFVFTDDKKIRIEVGYGLEGKITDILASRIIKEVIVPDLRRGDANTAMVNGVKCILNAIEDNKQTAYKDTTNKKVAGKGSLIIIFILGLAFLILAIINPSLAFWIIVNIFLNGRGGGGNHNNSRRGGGGSSGGGGASGSW